MAGISAPAVPTEPWRESASHEDISITSNQDSLLEKQGRHNFSVASSSRHAPSTRRKTRRKEKTGVEVACAWIVEHQIGLSINLLLLLFLTHLCYPRARHHTRKFLELSYYNESRDRYALGWDDIFLVFHWIVVFTGLRAATMDYILTPLAQWAGLNKKKEKARFAEQAWVLIYYGVFWSLGMYILCRSDYWLNLQNLWTGWPVRDLDSLFKWYYLVQFAFWLQQIVVVNIEERRKDHWQMLTHHIITCTLIFTSYGYHYYKVGNVILCLMDVVDIILPLAKLLKYLHYRVACDVAFGVFMVSWLVARHVLYLSICLSIIYTVPRTVIYGCYSGGMDNLAGPIAPPKDFSLAHYLIPFYDPEGLICWDQFITDTFLYMLLSLQVILLLWFVMILKVAWKVIKGGEAEDSRSDGEGSEEDLAEEDELEDVIPSKEEAPHPKSYLEIQPPLEEEVGVEGIRLTPGRTSPARRVKKGEGASTTAVSLRGHSAHKELLGRIGCDKQS